VRILLVEDDDHVAGSLADGLRRHGHVVDLVGTGAEALQRRALDMVLLDLGLPDLDGVEVVRRLRERSDVPIIVLTARSGELDRVLGLQAGADDYVVKPFGFRELLARIEAVVRRVSRSTGGAAEPPVGDDRPIGRLVLDPRTRQAALDGLITVGVTN
jgi:two-component system response regulator RegX3